MKMMINMLAKNITSGIFILLASCALLPGTALAADDVKKNGLGVEESGLKLDVEYQDTKANLSAPHHSFNTELDASFNNSPSKSSKEYTTRMGYRFDHVTPEASFSYSPDSYGFGKYYNYELGLAVPVKDMFSIETRYGWNQFDKKIEQGGLNNYEDWSVGVSTTYKGVKLKVDYIDVNASENSQECGQLFPCEGKTVFSIIKNF